VTVLLYCVILRFDAPVCSSYVVQIDGADISVDFASVDDEKRQARVVVTAPARSEPGAVHVLVGAGELLSSCTSACCAEASCTAACGDTATACFSLEYFDDRLPRIAFSDTIGTAQVTQSGPAIGGDVTLITLKNFPQVASSSEVDVTFGDKVGAFKLISSTSEETKVALVAPAAELGTLSSLLVDVAVTPKAQPDLAVSFEYVYEAVTPPGFLTHLARPSL
jgi:hypothetical protein